MLYYDRIEVSEEIDINKTSALKEYDICHCNGCHNVLMISINFNDFAVLNTDGADYCCIFNRTSESNALNLLKNADFTKKKGVLYS